VHTDETTQSFQRSLFVASYLKARHHLLKGHAEWVKDERLHYVNIESVSQTHLQYNNHHEGINSSIKIISSPRSIHGITYERPKTEYFACNVSFVFFVPRWTIYGASCIVGMTQKRCNISDALVKSWLHDQDKSQMTTMWQFYATFWLSNGDKIFFIQFSWDQQKGKVGCFGWLKGILIYKAVPDRTTLLTFLLPCLGSFYNNLITVKTWWS